MIFIGMKRLLLILAVTIMAILVTACVDGSTNNAPTEQQSPTDEELSVSKKNCIKRVGKYVASYRGWAKHNYSRTVVLLDNGSVLEWVDDDYDKSFTLLQPGDTLIYKMERDKTIPLYVVCAQ